MSSLRGINPAFSHLAYQKAIFEYLTNHLLEKCVSTEDSQPEQNILCPQLPGDSSMVPRDEVIHFITYLRATAARVEDEMNRFDFVRRDDGHDSAFSAILHPKKREEQKAPQVGSGTKPQSQGAQRRRRGGRGRRGRGGTTP